MIGHHWGLFNIRPYLRAIVPELAVKAMVA